MNKVLPMELIHYRVHSIHRQLFSLDIGADMCELSIYMNQQQPGAESRTDLVNSIVKAVRILDVLNQEGPLSFIEIFRKTPLPKSTLFKILATLEEERIVTREAESAKYRLGLRLIEWGGGARAQLDMRMVARPVMRALSADIDCTVHLTVIAHNEVLPIESVESGNWYWHHFKYPVAIGIPAPMHATGAGKAILAFLPDVEIRAVIGDKGLKRFTENTITDEEMLEKELEMIRERGYAISDAEHDELIRSVAAPIRNQDGRVIAALSALAVVSRFTPDRMKTVALSVTAAAEEISSLLGYRAGYTADGG